jgi:3-hydroxybutyrate dehydrogenase
MNLYVPPSFIIPPISKALLTTPLSFQPFSNFWIPPGTAPSKDSANNSRYKTLDINVTHPIRVTQLAIAHFLARRKPGVVVHISSVAGQVPFFPTPMYVASKHALNGFVRSLSHLETPPKDKLGTAFPKIRVVAVAPARILTPLWTAPENEDKLRMLNGDDVGWIMPEMVAGVMLDLVQKAVWVGGTILEVGEKVRVVRAFDDPGPGGGGNEVGHDMEREERDMWGSLERIFNGV